MGRFLSPGGRLLTLYERYWQLVRARVTIGLHADGWSLKRAENYLARKLDLPAEQALEAVRRYALLYPVESISYALGRLEIIRIREEARERLGDRFTLKAFHDRLLSYGGIPLRFIEEALKRDWK